MVTVADVPGACNIDVLRLRHERQEVFNMLAANQLAAPAPDQQCWDLQARSSLVVARLHALRR
jgi:hypothetical protein